MDKQTRYKLEYLAVMCSFGVLGPIVKAIGLPSSAVACLRACIAGLTLGLYYILKGTKISKDVLKKSALPLLASGLCMAGDWICLFSSYSYTTVATATVCYYMAPVFVVIGSALFLKEKISIRHYICIFVAFMGVAMVSGIVENGLPEFSEMLGVVIAICGGMFYALIILINKKYTSDVDPVFRTVFQLVVAGIITIPYVAIKEDVSSFVFTGKSILLLLLLGVVLTAIAYIIYFANIVRIPTNSAAIFAYGDPVIAVIVSVLFLGEPISIFGIIGAILVIGSAIFGELKK